MERLYHLSVTVLIVIFNHCLGEKTFPVNLVVMPAVGDVVIDLKDEDNTVVGCRVLDVEVKKHFICSSTTIRFIKPLGKDQTDVNIKLKVIRTNGTGEGSLVLHVGKVGEGLQLAKVLTIPEEMKPGTKVNKLFSINGMKTGDKVKYKLEGNDSKYLKIDADTGDVTSGDPVDRDGPTGRPFLDKLTITAAINKDKMFSKPLNITVLDINDNSPTFIKKVWTVEVLENSTKYPIATLKCTDLDEGDNAKIIQSISSPPGITLFSMSGESLVAEVLDYEAIKTVNKTYTLTVVAVDQPKSGDARTATAMVLVKVLPKNEFSPVWTHPFQGDSGATYTHSVYKNTKAGDVIFNLSAHDNDDGPDGEIVYGAIKTLTASGKPVTYIFHVEETKGDVHVIGQLTEPSYTFIVYAANNGSSIRTINATLNILVIDPPKDGLHWSRGQQKSSGNIAIDLPKNTTAGDVITTVAADGIPDGGISYEMGPVKQNGENLANKYIFIVGRSDGNLVALRTYKQYEEMGASSFTIIIYAKSGQGADQQKIECTVTVNLPKKTVNHAPVWVSPFDSGDGATAVVTIPENIQPGSAVATVKADDSDPGPAGTLSYRIGSIATDKGEEATDKFSFDPNSGSLTILSDLDREKGAKSFTVMLTALDSGDPPLTIQGILTIQVSDVNEFGPKLDQTMYRTTVTCDVQSGDDVLKIKMSDEDATSQFKLVPMVKSEYVVLKMLGPDSAAVFLVERPPLERFETDTFDEFIQFTVSDGGKEEMTVKGFLFVKFLKCDGKLTTPSPQPTEIVVTEKPMVTEPDKPQPTQEPQKTTILLDIMTSDVTPEVTSEPMSEFVTSEDGNDTDSNFTYSDVTTTAEQPIFVVPSSIAERSTTHKPGSESNTEVNSTKPHTGNSGGGVIPGSDDESGNWVVRSLCIIMFLGYVALGGLFLVKKFSLANLNCLRPKTAVHPRPEDNNDNVTGGSVVDYSERQAENMPDITAALAIASPNFMDTSQRELPQPPVSVTPSPSPAMPAAPVIPPVPSQAPLPPIPSILTEPPPAVPPLSTTSKMPSGNFLPPLAKIQKSCET